MLCTKRKRRVFFIRILLPSLPSIKAASATLLPLLNSFSLITPSPKRERISEEEEEEEMRAEEEEEEEAEEEEEEIRGEEDSEEEEEEEMRGEEKERKEGRKGRVGHWRSSRVAEEERRGEES
jgi:hypothetical protein